ncbi:MAG TPA: PAS domain-containing protein [Myxococcaceae bacterium]|nr:PAS domain-containing protein [Myxococcaceae bacterium]
MERLALLAALCLLAGAGVVSYASTRMWVDRAAWVEHTHRVIESLGEIRSGVAELEGMKRGFQITGDEQVVAGFDTASRRFSGLTTGLRQLTADNAGQQARLARLEPLLEDRVRSLSEAVLRVRRDGRAATAPEAEVEAGQAASRHIAALLAEMADEEGSLLAQREQSARRVIRYSYGAQALALALGVGIVLLAFGRLRRLVDLREASEEAARESEENLAITLQSIGDAVLSTDAQARVARMNPVAERLTGWSSAEARGRPAAEVFRIVNEKTRQPTASPIERALSEGVVVQLANHTALINKSGAEIPIADSAGPIRDAHGQVVGAVLVFRDTTRERAAADEVREARAFLESIVENIPNMIFVKEAGELRFARFNRAGEALLGAGRDVFIGKNDFDFFPEEQARFFQAKDRETLAGKVLLDIPEEPIETPAGKRWLHTKKIPILGEDGEPRFLLGISEDITDRKRLADQLRETNESLERRVAERTRELSVAYEELQRQVDERQKTAAALARTEDQLRQSQKMDAIGRLAGGIAHDFNNLLSVVLTLSDLRLKDLPEGDPTREDLTEIRNAGERAAALTRQLLAFSRQQVIDLKPVNLSAVVSNMDKLLRRVIGEDIRLETVAPADLGLAKADVGQLEQVLMNLVVNARDAMPKGGKLTIETANVVIDEAFTREHLGTTPGPHVMLAVSDTGSGVEKSVQARIFEPFFTTKEKGKGTGLGLATVFGIVKQLGGTIWVYSEVGKGSTFKVYLPRTDEGGNATAAPEAQAQGGNETILLVEDEAPVRKAAARILSRAGYKLVIPEDPRDALRMCVEHPGPIHLLLSDVVMPDKSGPALAVELLQARPGMRVLFMSGYTDEAVVRHGALDSGAAFVQKPLTPDTLTTKVREVLAKTKPPKA